MKDPTKYFRRYHFDECAQREYTSYRFRVSKHPHRVDLRWLEHDSFPVCRCDGITEEQLDEFGFVTNNDAVVVDVNNSESLLSK